MSTQKFCKLCDRPQEFHAFHDQMCLSCAKAWVSLGHELNPYNGEPIAMCKCGKVWNFECQQEEGFVKLGFKYVHLED